MEFKYLHDANPLLFAACQEPWNKKSCHVINGALKNINRLTKIDNDTQPKNKILASGVAHRDQMIGTLQLCYIMGGLVDGIGRDQEWSTSQKIKVFDNIIQKIEDICKRNIKN